MASFFDGTGLSQLWTRITSLLNNKADKNGSNVSGTWSGLKAGSASSADRVEWNNVQNKPPLLTSDNVYTKAEVDKTLTDLSKNIMPTVWTYKKLLYAYNLNDITYGNNKFVAVGPNDKVFCSSDGITWDDFNISDFPYQANAIVYSDLQNRFIAVGSDGEASYSTDGVTWTPISNMPFGTNDILDIAYGDIYYIAVTNSAGAISPVGTSMWEIISDEAFSSVGPRIITYGGDRFVGIGALKAVYSTNGTDWTESSTIPVLDSLSRPTGIAYGNGKFVLVTSKGTGAYSVDGHTWTKIEDIGIDAGTRITAIAYGNGKFVILAYANLAAYSTNGITWTRFEIIDYYRQNSLTYGNNRFVAIGDNGGTSHSIC